MFVVSFDFENNTSNQIAFDGAMSVEVTQNDVKLRGAVVTGVNGVNINSAFETVKPGKDITLQKAYTIEDETAPVNVSVYKYGEEGIMHGFNSIMLKDENGDPAPVYSVASGLDYPSSGPEHAFLHDLGRVKYDVINDEETIDAFFELSRMEGIIPAIESSHAVAYGIKLAKTLKKGSVLINLSGRGDKDMDYIIEKYGIR